MINNEPRSGAATRDRLARARLYLCTDARSGVGRTLDLIKAAIDGGVDIVQLRDKSLSAREELALLESTRQICQRRDALFAVNDRADLALLAGADILHIGQDDLPVAAARSLVGEAMLIGRSTHSQEQADVAAADPQVDYFCVGPVWETPTKPGRPATGLDVVGTVSRCEPAKPWFAIGGIDVDRLPTVVAAGAERIVVVRAITRAADPATASRTLRDGLPRPADRAAEDQ